MTNPFITSELQYDDFILNPHTVVTESETITSGYVLAAKTVLGKITATGYLAPLDEGASDGTETPYAILVDSVDTTSSALTRYVYKAGSFNQNKVIYYSTGSSNASVKDAFRLKGIFLLDTIGTTTPTLS